MDPFAPDTSLLDALQAYQALFHRYLEAFGAEGGDALRVAFERLVALQRERMPALGEAFELLEHVHQGAEQAGRLLAATGPAALTVPSARATVAQLCQRQDAIVGDCVELLRQLH